MVLRRLIAGALILAVPIALCIAYRPDQAIRVATGLVAHNICSKTFVSGLDPQTVFAETTDRDGIRLLASARDWARFGLLYLNDGAIGGRRILHEDWVDFSAAAALDTDYGAGFWTNRSENENAKARVSLGIPRDAFFASRDQRIVIIPSQHLVIVRLCDPLDPSGDIRGLGRLVKEVIASTQH